MDITVSTKASMCKPAWMNFISCLLHRQVHGSRKTMMAAIREWLSINNNSASFKTFLVKLKYTSLIFSMLVHISDLYFFHLRLQWVNLAQLVRQWILQISIFNILFISSTKNVCIFLAVRTNAIVTSHMWDDTKIRRSRGNFRGENKGLTEGVLQDFRDASVQCECALLWHHKGLLFQNYLF